MFYKIFNQCLFCQEQKSHDIQEPLFLLFKDHLLVHPAIIPLTFGGYPKCIIIISI